MLDEIFIRPPGSCPGVGLGGTMGGWGQFFFPEFIQIWCVSYSHEWHMHQHKFFGSRPPGALGRGQKFNFLNMVMWHIKLKGMSSRPGYTKKITYNQAGDLGKGSKG